MQRIEATGVKVELLEKKQERQEKKVEDIDLILPLLLAKGERKHLFKLESGKTRDYKGRGTLRAELRRLRSMRLIRMRSEHYVGDMKDGLIFNLADYVELTELGKQWVQRIKEIEEAEISDEDINEEEQKK